MGTIFVETTDDISNICNELSPNYFSDICDFSGKYHCVYELIGLSSLEPTIDTDNCKNTDQILELVEYFDHNSDNIPVTHDIEGETIEGIISYRIEFISGCFRLFDLKYCQI